MTVSLIAAVAENGTIGKDNAIPWRLPLDLRWFQRRTMGHTIILGRRTLESIGGRPLPGRRTIAVSRREGLAPEGVEVVRSVAAALALAQERGGNGEVFVAGGQEIYREALPRADRIYLTRIHRAFDGDAFFPPFDESEFEVVEREDHPQDETNPLPFTFLIYQRKRRGEGGGKPD